jgi:TP901 family phage tail tape measure protein
VAAEDFNISLGLDASSADKELTAFVAKARRQARELRKELASIKTPKLTVSADVSSSLRQVDILTKKIERLKKSVGASSKDPMAAIKPADMTKAQEAMKRVESRMATLKISLQQLNKVGSKSPAATASLVDVRLEMKKLEAQKKAIADNAIKQAAEIRKAQQELAKEYSDPKVIAAANSYRESLKSNKEAQLKADSERSRIMKEIERLERSPEVIAAMKGQVAGLKEMRARASKMNDEARKELSAIKADFAAGKADRSKVDAAAKKVKTLHEYILWASAEIETLSDAGPRTKGLKSITKKMGVKAAYGGDSGVRGETPTIRSTSIPNSKDYQKIIIEAQKLAKQSIEIGLARGSKTIAETRPNKQTTGGVVPNLIIAALHQLFPNKVSAEQAGAASRGEGGIGVVLRDTKTDIATMLENLAQAEREMSGSDSELAQTMSELAGSIVDLTDQMGDGKTSQGRSGRRLSATDEAAQREIVMGGGTNAIGSVVTASEDTVRNLRDANDFTQRLLEALSAGDDQRKKGGVSDRRGGVFAIQTENAIGLADDAVLKFATVTADEFEMAVELATKAGQFMQAAAGTGGSIKGKIAGAPLLSNRTNQGMYFSSFAGGKGALTEGRDSELDAAKQEDKKSGELKLVRIGLGQEEKALEAAIDRGFQEFLKGYLKLEEKPKVGVKDIVGPLGTFASAKPGSEAEKIIKAIQAASQQSSTDRNMSAIDATLGASSPFATLIKSLIAKVTAGVNNPVLESTGMSGDMATFQYQALGNNDTAGAMSEIGSIQDDFISMVHYLAILYDKAGLKVQPGITRGNYQDIADSSTAGTQADPHMDSFLRLFNATRAPGKLTIPALDGSGQRLRDESGAPLAGEIENVFQNFGEQLTPFTQVLQDLAVVFADIYKMPMAGNLGKMGKFNSLGLPDPSGTAMTHGQAFTQNRQGYIADMLRASVENVQKPDEKKDATDKAGGALVPIDAMNGILEKLSTITEAFYGGPAQMTGTMEDGKVVDISNQLLDAMVQAFSRSRQGQDNRTIGMGIQSQGTLPAAQSAIRAKYGETVNGLTAGLAPGVARAEQAGADTAIAFIDGYETKMEIQSPSKRMRQSGEDTIDGLRVGLFGGIEELDKAGRALAESFDKGYTEQAKVDAVKRIQAMQKAGDIKGADLATASMRKAPVADVKPATSSALLSSQEEIQRRNAANLAQLDRLRAQGEDLLVALDIESTGGRNADHPRGGLRNRVFGYSAVAGAGEFSREQGMLPGAPVVTPRMTGISHGMVVPPKDQGQLFTGHVAGVLGLQGADGTNLEVLPNLIKRIASLGYGKENTTGSEKEYVKQLEDIAALLTKLYEDKIPLAIHNAGVSDLSALGKEFAHYGITAPTAGQFKDANLLVETQSMGKMLGGYMKDFGGKVSLSVGKIYELFTGKAMGAELIPPVGNVPKLADSSAVAHDPTIDTAATLVNAATMRAAAGNAGIVQTGLLGKKIALLDATWQKVSDAIWGSRKFGSPGQAGNVGGMTTGDPKELNSFKRQAATHGGQLQPVYGPQQAPAPTPVVVPDTPAQDPQAAAQEAGDAAARQAKAIDALEKEKARIRKEKARIEFQYQVDLVEQDMSVLKNLQGELDKPLKQGQVHSKQLAADMAKLQATIDKKLKESSELADGVRRQLDANGGVRTLFRAQKGKVSKSDKQKELEKQVKDTQKEIDAQLGIQPEVKPKATRSPGSVIAAPLEQLQAAEKRIQDSLTNAVSNSLGPALVSRLEQELAYVQKSIKTGPVGKRRMRDAQGNLTDKEVDVFKAEGVRGAKDRVAGKSQIATIKKELLAELKVAEERGYTETIEAVSKLIAELDASVASGPVGKYKNGRDAFELPDAYRKKAKKENIKISNVEGTAAPGAYDSFTHQSWMDQNFDAEAKNRKAASEAIKGQMKGEMTTMAQVEKYNRKMMDSWISGRYALYDVANTYQQFQRVLMGIGREMKNAVQTFASFETSFTSVERAMQPLPDEFAGMRNEIVKLTGELPVAFDELSKITTLGAQMGIKADGITNFTEQVTKFSAITGLASDTVAQKFGRISQLAKVPSEDFDKLGSAVAYAGVNAVATDEEILTLTENISAAANNSGFAADEIVGLATAMSSLGIAPEQARGVITRLFGDINRAVEGGGKPLDAYAKHLGMSAVEAKNLWKSDPQGFFKAMLDGLSKSKNMTAALDGLNIKETREVSTLQKLAGNMDVYNQSISDAQESYANGSFLADSYAKTQDNLATKMELVNNQVKMLQDSFGQALAPLFMVLADAAKSVLEIFNSMSKNPMGQWAMRLVTGIAALVAVMITYKMVSMKATASLLAFRTAQVSLSKISGQDAGIGGFAKMLMGQEQLIIRSNGRIEVASKKRIKQMEASGEIKVAKRGSSEDIALKAGVDARRAGLDSTQGIINQKNGMSQATLDSNKDTLATIDNTNAKNGNTAANNANAASSEANAASSMTESEAKTASVMATEAEIAANQQLISSKQAALVLIENDIVAKETSILAGEGNVAVTEAMVMANRQEAASISQEIIALETKNAALAASNTATAETVAVMTAAESVTNKFGTALSRLSMAAGAISIVLMAVSAISTYLDSLNVNLEEAGGGLASFREAIYKDTSAYRAAEKAQKGSGEAISTYSSKITTAKTSLADWAVGLQSATGSEGDLTDAVSQTTDEVDTQTLALGKNAVQWLANAAMQDNVIQDMFKGYFNGGQDLGELARKANSDIGLMIQAALKLPGTGAKEYLTSTFQALNLDPAISSRVYNDLMKIAESLDKTTIAGVQNSKVIKTLMGTFGATDDEVTNLNENLNNTAEKVYTLTNYVSDLSGLLSSAFTIRYGLTESVDKMANAWTAVKDRLTEAKKQMQAINQEISGMTADKNILEYQLSVALNYGDTLRADKIRAAIAAKNAEIAGKQDEYNKAAQDASTSLTGMSAGAINNRETMRSMVQTYNERIAAYANAQKTATNKADRARIQAEADALKADFIAKARALGFAENELAPYVKSFGDLKTIVAKLPNTLTIKVNADPGMRAWLEWWAANKDGNGNVVVVDKDPKATPKPDPGAADPGAQIGQIPTVPDSGKVWTKHTKTTKIKKDLNSKLTNSSSIDYGIDGRNPMDFLTGEKAKAKKARDDYHEKRRGVFGAKLKKAGIDFDFASLKDITDANGFTAEDRVKWKKMAAHQVALSRAFNQFTIQSDGTIAVRVEDSAAADTIFRNLAKQLPAWVIEDINILKQAVAYKTKGTGLLKSTKDAYDAEAERIGAKKGIANYNGLAHSDKVSLKGFYKAWQSASSYANELKTSVEGARTELTRNGYNYQNLSYLLDGTMWKAANGYASGGLIPGVAPSNPRLDNMFASSPSGTIAVRSGEYIQSQQAVRYYGVDFMNAINKMQMPRLMQPTQSYGSSSSGSIMVELSPNAVMQLMAMSNRPINLYSDDRQIASSANRGNRLLAMRGSN